MSIILFKSKTIPHHSTSIVVHSTNTVENYFLACSNQKDVINDEIISLNYPT